MDRATSSPPQSTGSEFPAGTGFALLDAMADAIVVADGDLTIVHANGAAGKLFAADPAALAGMPLGDLVPGVQDATQNTAQESAAGCEAHAIGLDGRAFPAHVSAGLYTHGQREWRIVTIRDLSDQRAIERQLLARSLRDPLTSLPARTLFLEQIDAALSRWRTQGGDRVLAILCLGLDRFKTVNDSLGYPVGDELLVAVAGRLSAELGTGAVLARLSGDEFGVMVNGVAREADAAVVAERVLGIFAQAFELSGRSLTITASIGLSYATSGDAASAQLLLSNADIALLRAKRTGGGRIEIFEPARHGEALGLLEIELGLREALERREFDVVYQPIVDIKHGDMRGVEALLRWNRGGAPSVPPSVFVPVAEESGLIVRIGEWVLRRACAQMVEWRRRFGAAAPDFVAVNLSARQLDRDDVPALVRRVLAETGLPARHLELELTESTVVENADAGREVLKQVVAQGVALSIDDFGTGQSSLSQLPRLPISKIKIDRAFVGRMDSENESFEIVRVIVGLAHALGMQTVAEGIERQGQLDLLRAMGCGLAQGYLFHRPMAVRDIDALCAKDAPAPPVRLPPGLAATRAIR